MAAEPAAARGFTPARRLIAGALVMDLAVAVVGLAVQFKGQVLGATPLQLGLLGTFSSLAYTIFCLFTGTISDRQGRRLLTAVSCIGCGIVWLMLIRADSPVRLLALMPFSGAFIAMFWPPTQAWLSQLSDTQRALRRNIGDFNLSWTVGLMIGPPIAGVLWGYSQAVPFLFAAGCMVALVVFMQTVGGGRKRDRAPAGADPTPLRHDPALVRHFLHLAWIANFAAWFARGLTNVVFPKLGSDLGMSEGLIGTVIAAFLAGQLVVFIYLRKHSGWQWRLWPLLVALASGCAGMVLSYFARTPMQFTIGLGLSGMGGGVTYFASLFYSLQGHVSSRGASSGIHEAVLGSGIFLGPLVGGMVANSVDLHSPFLLAAAVFALTGIVCWLVWQMRRRRVQAQVREAAEVASE